MRESPYDRESFFAAYSQMLRSQKGLDGAGEWHVLRRMLPDFAGRRVLDLGCGFGWHCGYAARQGAARVVGVELSEKMLARAREQNGAAVITYVHMPMEEYAFAAEAFDVVLSSLALHYVEDFEGMCRRIFSTLAPGGTFVFSVEHPVFTAEGTQDWVYGPDGEILHWPVDRYFSEGARQTMFLGERVKKFHRTLTTYLGALLAAGFAIEDVQEPQPPAEMLELPGMRDELRRPMMLLVRAGKAGE